MKEQMSMSNAQLTSIDLLFVYVSSLIVKLSEDNHNNWDETWKNQAANPNLSFHPSPRHSKSTASGASDASDASGDYQKYMDKYSKDYKQYMQAQGAATKGQAAGSYQN